jgi:Ca2+-binding EF-hand superfamily protein
VKKKTAAKELVDLYLGQGEIRKALEVAETEGRGLTTSEIRMAKKVALRKASVDTFFYIVELTKVVPTKKEWRELRGQILVGKYIFSAMELLKAMKKMGQNISKRFINRIGKSIYVVGKETNYLEWYLDFNPSPLIVDPILCLKASARHPRYFFDDEMELLVKKSTKKMKREVARYCAQLYIDGRADVHCLQTALQLTGVKLSNKKLVDILFGACLKKDSPQNPVDFNKIIPIPQKVANQLMRGYISIVDSSILYGLSRVAIALRASRRYLYKIRKISVGEGSMHNVKYLCEELKKKLGKKDSEKMIKVYLQQKETYNVSDLLAVISRPLREDEANELLETSVSKCDGDIGPVIEAHKQLGKKISEETFRKIAEAFKKKK